MATMLISVEHEGDHKVVEEAAGRALLALHFTRSVITMPVLPHDPNNDNMPDRMGRAADATMRACTQLCAGLVNPREARDAAVDGISQQLLSQEAEELLSRIDPAEPPTAPLPTVIARELYTEVLSLRGGCTDYEVRVNALLKRLDHHLGLALDSLE